MTSLSVVTYPSEILKTVCKSVENIDQSIIDLVEAMKLTMIRKGGVGLAAPQVDIPLRVITVGVVMGECLTYINPIVIDHSGEVDSLEGCLSLPGISAEVKRHKQISVTAYDLQGKELNFEADGFFAIVLQHEIDHLNGTLYIDRLSPLKRKFLLRELQEYQKP